MLKLILKMVHFLWHFIKKPTWLFLITCGFFALESYAQTDTARTLPPTNPESVSPGVAAEDKEIKGKILDETGEPIIGAIIAIKGTNIGTVTNENGEYTLRVPAANANGTVVVSYVGYNAVELPLATTLNFDVSLKEEGKVLNEVIVIGYGTQEKEDVTGAITSVKTADLNKVVVVDASQALQGRAAGVTVTQNSGAPGAPLSIRVRGVGTIGGSDPLYVVNGVPMLNNIGISFLNSNDIESINVLKDASAAAVYGSRAANGVILVTTKSGRSQKTIFDFNFLTGVSREWKRLNLLNAKQWGTLRNEASLAQNGALLYNTDTLGEGTDWQNEIFRRAIMNSYQLSASGATEKLNYYFSGSYLSQQGILKNSSFDRFNFDTKNDYQLTKRLKIGTYLDVAFYNRSQLYDDDPYNSILVNALNMDPITRTTTNRGGDSLYASGFTNGTDIPNPLARLNYFNNRYRGTNFLGNWFGEYEILKGLKVKSSLSYLLHNLNNSQFNGSYFVSPSEQLPQSQITAQQNLYRTLVWENSVSYTKRLNENHKVGGLFLVGIQNNRSEILRAVRSGTSSNDESQQFLSSASGVATASGIASESSLLSYLFRVDYEFRNKYLLTANARLDGASRFPENNRWATFPSVAAGWKISEEGFFAGAKDYVSFMKLRGSWGQLGNQNLVGGLGFSSDYPFTTNISSQYNYSFNNSPATGAAPLGAGNPNIKWETVTLANLGLDLGFAGNKLLFSADYFTKRTSDMLIRKLLPYYSGTEEPPYVNAGEMLNKGLELSAEYRNQIGKFTYRVTGNLTTIKNTVTILPDPVYDGQFRTSFTNITREGESIAQFYGYQTDGIVQTPEEAASLQIAQPGVTPGDFKFKDLDGDNVITDKDRTILGTPLPKYTYGFSGELGYAGFDLNLFFQGSQGNQIFNGSKYNLEGGVPNSNFSQSMLNRWTGPGTTNEIPKVTSSDANNNRRISDYYIEDGSYLRLKNVQLGYTIPERITSKARIQRIRIYVSSQNLLTFTKYSGLDPEVGTYTPDYNVTRSYLDIGVDKGGTYPQARTFMIGLNASF